MIHALQMAGTIAANMTSLSQLFGGAGVDPQPRWRSSSSSPGSRLPPRPACTSRSPWRSSRPTGCSRSGAPGSGDLAGWGRRASPKPSATGLRARRALHRDRRPYRNLALGAINRAMPQLMVAFVGAPATVWGALALLASRHRPSLPSGQRRSTAVLAHPVRGPVMEEETRTSRTRRRSESSSRRGRKATFPGRSISWRRPPTVACSPSP
jgi:flagellar biosynthesis protein FliR